MNNEEKKKMRKAIKEGFLEGVSESLPAWVAAYGLVIVGKHIVKLALKSK